MREISLPAFFLDLPAYDDLKEVIFLYHHLIEALKMPLNPLQ